MNYVYKLVECFNIIIDDDLKECLKKTNTTLIAKNKLKAADLRTIPMTHSSYKVFMGIVRQKN